MGCCSDEITRVAAGAAGVAKSVAGVGVATDDVIKQRRKVCRACPSAVRCTSNVKLFCTCSECGCMLVHKTRLAGESCPMGKW